MSPWTESRRTDRRRQWSWNFEWRPHVSRAAQSLWAAAVISRPCRTRRA